MGEIDDKNKHNKEQIMVFWRHEYSNEGDRKHLRWDASEKLIALNKEVRIIFFFFTI